MRAAIRTPVGAAEMPGAIPTQAADGEMPAAIRTLAADAEMAAAIRTPAAAAEMREGTRTLAADAATPGATRTLVVAGEIEEAATPAAAHQRTVISRVAGDEGTQATTPQTAEADAETRVTSTVSGITDR